MLTLCSVCTRVVCVFSAHVQSIEADMTLNESVEWSHLSKRAQALRKAITSHCSGLGKQQGGGGVLSKVTVLPNEGDQEAEGLSASWCDRSPTL